jgi:hypothetical protein
MEIVTNRTLKIITTTCFCFLIATFVCQITIGTLVLFQLENSKEFEIPFHRVIHCITCVFLSSYGIASIWKTFSTNQNTERIIGWIVMYLQFETVFILEFRKYAQLSYDESRYFQELFICMIQIVLYFTILISVCLLYRKKKNVNSTITSHYNNKISQNKNKTCLQKQNLFFI